MITAERSPRRHQDVTNRVALRVGVSPSLVQGSHLLADMVLRDARPILLVAGAVHDIFGIRLLAERRVAARRFRILRLEETDVLPRPAVVGGIGHPDGEVLARTDDAKAHPGLPPLVIPHDEFGVYSRLGLRNLLRGKVVGLPEPELAEWLGVGCRVGAGKRADR